MVLTVNRLEVRNPFRLMAPLQVGFCQRVRHFDISKMYDKGRELD